MVSRATPAPLLDSTEAKLTATTQRGSKRVPLETTESLSANAARVFFNDMEPSIPLPANPPILLTDDGIVDIGSRMMDQLARKRKLLREKLIGLNEEILHIDKEVTSWKLLVTNAKARLAPPAEVKP